MDLSYEQLKELASGGASIHVHLDGGASGGPPPDNGGGDDPDDPDDPGDQPQWIISSRATKGPRLYSPYQRSGTEPDPGGGLRIMLQTNNKKVPPKPLILQATDKMLVIDGPTKYATEAGLMDFYHVMSFRDEAVFAVKWLKVAPPEAHIFWVRTDQVQDV